ncbi:MAG: flagellar hook-basal body complex protein FliE [Rhizobiaceae bacterium]|jgi:flagellar hook-basal body complex protein FliE|nr:flagellar hook-basal body complex protein FliE [Rhizobiaceae bacterium]
MVAPIHFNLLPQAASAFAAPDGAASVDFGAMVAAAGRDAMATMRAAETVAMDGLAGRATIQDVVDGVMAAERTFQASLAIRDKAVSAWLDLSRMTI